MMGMMVMMVPDDDDDDDDDKSSVGVIGSSLWQSQRGDFGRDDR